MPVTDWLPAAVRAVALDRKLRSGEVLFRLGDKTVGFYEVIAGRVRLTRVDRSGSEIILYVAGAGETIAEASLFAAAYHCDAIASTDAVVRLYAKPAMLAAFQKDPKAAQAFTAMLGHQVMSLRTRLEQRNIRSARERVRHLSRAQCRRRRPHRHAGRHAQGSRRRTGADPRSILPHAGRARTHRRDQTGQRQDHAAAPVQGVIPVICGFRGDALTGHWELVPNGRPITGLIGTRSRPPQSAI